MTSKNWLQSLTKSETDRWIGGVCGGLGEHTPVPSWTWRLIFTLLLFVGGTGLLLYLLLWIFVPRKPKIEDSQLSV
jgi:phage shock protein C